MIFREYFELMVEECYFAKQFQKAIDMIDKIKLIFEAAAMEQKFIQALIAR